MFILKKKIDWSLLTAGMTIPVEFQPIIQQLKGGIVKKGEARTIKILIGQDVFEATLKNIDFDRKNIKIMPIYYKLGMLKILRLRKNYK